MQDFIFYVATCPNGLDDFEEYKGLKRLPVGAMRIVISADSWDENGKATYHASDLQVSMLKEWMAGQFDMRGYAINPDAFTPEQLHGLLARSWRFPFRLDGELPPPREPETIPYIS